MQVHSKYTITKRSKWPFSDCIYFGPFVELSTWIYLYQNLLNRVQYRIPTQYLVRISDNVLYLISEVVVQSNNSNNVCTYTNEGLWYVWTVMILYHMYVYVLINSISYTSQFPNFQIHREKVYGSPYEDTYW